MKNSLFLNTSRYVQGSRSEYANGRIEWAERKIFPSDSSDVFYLVENNYEGNPQIISSIFYGEPRYWWFICQYNNILDPVGEIVAGRQLQIPTKDRMMLMFSGVQGGYPSQRELMPTVPVVIV